MRQRLTSDDDLMQAAAAGDRAAFSEIVKRHQGWVRSLMIAFVHNADQADDLTQDAFCRAFQNVEGYDPQGQFTAWLKRIAINRAKDFLRRQKQATFVPLHEWEEMPATDRRGDPIAALATGALRDDLRAAIEGLPDEQRLALVMYYFGDMSLQDIGWALKCPVGTVKSRLFYALRRVRQRLTTLWDEEGDPDNDG
jgi:RNA polymerase sigma-70 factor (ECF subfamily)